MDADISDILSSLSRGLPQAEGVQYIGDAERELDQQHLTKAWVAERVSPELLPFPSDLMARIMRRIRQQIETIEDHTARMDAGTSFSLVVMQTELERFKFLVRSFLRIRLSKIDAHSLHILHLHQSQIQSLDDPFPLLSPEEVQYLTSHAALLEKHYNASFLASFPTKLRRLDDKAGAGGSGMVEGPDIDKSVFVRCLGTLDNKTPVRANSIDLDDEMGENDVRGPSYGVIEISCGFGRSQRSGHNAELLGQTQTQEVPLDEAEKTVVMRRGEIWMVRWGAVRHAVREGLCELL